VVRVASPYLGGINQHVTLVSQPEVRIIDGFARPDAGNKEIRLEITLENNTGAAASADVTASWGEFKPSHGLGTTSARVTVQPGRAVATLVLPVPRPRLWTFDQPNLYAIGIAS